MKFPAFFLLLPALFLALAPASAQLGFGANEEPRVQASLVPEVEAVAPGKAFTVWLRFEHAPGWHTYYANPGLLGNAPSIRWELPEGFAAGPIEWPVPKLAEQAGETIYGYEDVTLFPVEITPAADLAPGETVTLTAHATWQVCEDLCLNEEATLTLNLPVAAQAVPNAEAAAELDRARSEMPIASDAWRAEATSEGDMIVLTLMAGEGAVTDPGEVYFFSSDRQTDAQIEQSVEQIPGGLRITARRATENLLGEEIPVLPHLSGIVRAERGWVEGNPSPGLIVDEVPFAAASTTADEPLPMGDPAKVRPVFLTLGGMFLGGLILNLMPCVFPVIGIKIMGFVQQAGHERKKVALHGVIFAAGVLLSFWALALLLALGGITSWGNQLQDPRVILVTILILLLFGMNLFGVFEIGTSATGIGGNLTHKQGVAGTFFSGVLATLIATPCSGPFLGVAIGAAAALSGPMFFLAFTLMGLGLALPYLVLSLFPQWVDRLPRPGPWMESFKQGMSFLVFAAAGVFLWVYAAMVFDHEQKGLLVMLGLAAVATAGWIYGRWTNPIRGHRVRVAARLMALVFLIAGAAMAWPPSPETTAEAAPAIEWETWSPEKAEAALGEGRPVFVDFTARWCLTCQLNKARAYTPEVVRLVEERNILMLRADKTNPNPEIERALADLGRSAIPVNVLLVPGEPPFITPELLSPEILIELFSARTELP